MVKTHNNITLGHSFLQGVWTDIQEADGNKSSTALTNPDRRLSVCHGGCDKTEAGRNPGRNNASNSDGLLGSLLAESFLGAVFAPLLPLWAQTMDWSSLAEGIDTAWLDCRRPVPRATPGLNPAFVPL